MTTGRNEPCPCGSGKKYKQCCLKKGDPAIHRRRRQALMLLAAVLVLAVVSGIVASREIALAVGGVGTVLVGVWMWFTVPPPSGGGGSDPSAINFGR